MQWCFGTLREDPHQDQPPSLRVGLADTIALFGVFAVISVLNASPTVDTPPDRPAEGEGKGANQATRAR